MLPRVSYGNSSLARGLVANALFLITVEATAPSETFCGCAGRASSGNCSNARGLVAKARFFPSSATIDFVGAVTALRVSQGNSSLARGLAATARLFKASTWLNTWAELVEMFNAMAAKLTASRYIVRFVFTMLFLVMTER